jgi:hypothetical protein
VCPPVWHHELRSGFFRSGAAQYRHNAYCRIRDERLGISAVFSFRRDAEAIAVRTLLIPVNNGSSACLRAVLIRKPLIVRKLLSISPRLLFSPRDALNARSE